MNRRSLLGAVAAAVLVGGGVVVSTTAYAATTASIQGTITDATTHAPIAGVEVTAMRRGGPGQDTGTAQTDAAGHYEIANLPIAGYAIRAFKLNYAEQVFDRRSDSDEANLVYLP